jgi:uncharacterized protein (TIGR02246 family)
MIVGRILLCSVLLLVANAAYAKYDRALDGKTKVWHNTPQRGVEPSWSGDRDRKGFATGRGTLTWFKVQRSWLTGSLLPGMKYITVSQYTGKMIDGKLEGPVVSVDAKGNTYHAEFADGHKTGEWIAGSLPASKKHTDQDAGQPQVVEAPAEGPPPAPKLDQHVAEKSQAKPAQPSQIAAEPTVVTEPKPEHSGDSLRSLAMPPSSLRVASLNESSSHRSAPPADTADTTAPASGPESSPPATAAPASAAIPGNDNDARTVAALDTEYQAAVKTNDATTIDRILADDFVLMNGPGQTLTKADLLKQAHDKQAKYERHEIQEGTQKVRVWRDTAVVTETVWVKGAENGKPIDQKIATTATYVRTPGGWRFVSGQAAAPAK